MIDEKFYTDLKKFFRSQGITQQQIAEEYGTTQAYINLLLNGKCALGKGVATKLNELYGLSVAWLLTGDGDMIDHSKQSSDNVININRFGDTKGNNNSVGNTMQDSDTVNRLLDELQAQRKQIDELISIIKTKL